MHEKIRVAFIYKRSNIFLTGKHFDNTYYHFFMNALRRNKEIDVTYFATEERFDASVLKNNFDVILLWSNIWYGMPTVINGIQELDMPVIARCGDPRDTKNAIQFHKKWKIDYYFHFIHKDFFYETGYPRNFKFKTIIFGLEPSLYQNVTPFNQRIKNRILNSGNIGNIKLLSRIINKIRNPKWNNLSCYYLRTICNKLPYVDYSPTLSHEYVNDKYPLLLQKYAASIAAGSYTPAIKYWENPAAGCLTFMEITKKNRGEYLGYIDGETAVFINEKNYKQKFEEYLSDINNPKWEKIANAGREFTLKTHTNDKAVESLVELMKNLL
jgi:hypothetical protein